VRVQESTEHGRAEGRLANKMADHSTTAKRTHIDGMVTYVLVGGECGVRIPSDEGDDAVTGTVLPTVAVHRNRRSTSRFSTANEHINKIQIIPKQFSV